jgi:hypothetical protein
MIGDNERQLDTVLFLSLSYRVAVEGCAAFDPTKTVLVAAGLEAGPEPVVGCGDAHREQS